MIPFKCREKRHFKLLINLVILIVPYLAPRIFGLWPMRRAVDVMVNLYGGHGFRRRGGSTKLQSEVGFRANQAISTSRISAMVQARGESIKSP